VAGIMVGKVILDTGAQSVLVGRRVGEELERRGHQFKREDLYILEAGGGESSTLGTSCKPVEANAEPRDSGGVHHKKACRCHHGHQLLTHLLGVDFCMAAEIQIDFKRESVHYRFGASKGGTRQSEA